MNDSNNDSTPNNSDVQIKSELQIEMGNSDKDDGEITINDKIRQSIFYILCIEYCISSCDGGIIPQQNKHIQIDFIEDIEQKEKEEEEESRVGLFGSIDYIGRIIGAILMSLLINKIHRKYFFCCCCFFKAITCIIPLISKDYYINLIARLLSGIPQTLLTSYGTIWTDQFGRWKKRSLMLPIFQLAALVGIMVGYGFGIISDVILKDINYGKKEEEQFYGWRLCFLTQGVILGVLGMILIAFPKIYFSSTFYLNKNDDYKGREKTLEEINKEKGQENNKFYDLWKKLPKILCTKIFIFISLGNTVAFFGMRVIQFYADKYMEKVLHVEESKKFIYYIVLCMTGPVIGILICGVIITKIGGYASKNGMIFILILNIIACIISIFITISLNTFIALGSAWLYLFCFAAVTPLQGGVIIASLPKELKGNGYSINMFFLNAIGSFPSSYVFSLICDFIQDNYPEQGYMRYRTTMRITMFYNFVGLILISIGSIFRFRLSGELGNPDNNKLINEEDNKENIEEKNNGI